MNNTEQFDEWIRGEMADLDDSPGHFRQAAIWQKLQAELHPVPEKRLSFFRKTVTMPIVRRAAAVVILLLAGGLWWKIESIPTQMAINPEVSKSKSSPVVQQKQTSLAAKNGDLKEKVTFKKQSSPKKQSREIPTELNFVKVQNFDKVETPIESSTEIESDAVVPVPTAEQAERPVVAKTTPKPKFKIVHANELADYHKAELAERREKEAKAKGFVVINWNANSTNQSANSLLTYFKNKSSKAD